MKNYLFVFFIFISIFANSQNNSLYFDGIDDYTSEPFISGDFRTIEFWINSDFPIDGSSSPNIPVNFSNPYEYVGFNNISSIQSGETISIVSDNGSSNPLSSCDAIISGGWHHIAFVANGSNYDKIYIDGVAANMLVTNASLQGFNELNLGKRVNNGPFIEAPYSGFIDEFRIWNFAKSQSQISAQMSTELTGNESGLLVYYKFDEDMSPCDVEDCTSAENHSSNFGSTYSSTVAPISDVICGAPINCGVATIPNCIQLINPFDGETGVLVDADISWSSEPTAVGYILSIGTFPGGSDIVNNLDVGFITFFDPVTDFNYYTTYYVTIIPYNSGGLAQNCSEESFTTELPIPNCTHISSPIDGEIDVNVNTNINWNSVAYADGYILSMGTTPGGVDLVDNLDLGNVLFFNPTNNLPYNTTIYINITPYNASGLASNCMDESFITQQDVPSCTLLNNPINGTTDVDVNTAISWNASPSAFGYLLFVGTTSGGTDILNGVDIGNILTYSFSSSLPYETEVFVIIIPYNNTGQGQGCVEESFITQVDIPLCTILSNPINGSVEIPTIVLIEWGASLNALGYRLNVGTSLGGIDILNNFDVGSSLSYLLNGLPYFTEIFVTIIPYNNTGESIGCLEESFTTLLPLPNCTNLVNPFNGQTNVSINVLLEWVQVIDTDGFILRVGTSLGGGEIINNFNIGLNLFYQLSNLPEGALIYWNVTPYNSSGEALNCQESSFTTEFILPNCTSLIYPTNGSSNIDVDLLIEWYPSINADEYKLSLGTTPNGTDILDRLNVGNSLSYMVNNLPYNTTIYVNIIPFNLGGEAINCQEESFLTKMELPECTTMVYPFNGSVDIPLDLLIEWNLISNTDGYLLNIGTTSGVYDILNGIDVGNVNEYSLGNLPNGINVYVNIAPYNTSGQALDCNEEVFSTIGSIPICSDLITPSNGGQNISVSTNIEWLNVSNSTGYILSIGTTPNGNEVMDSIDIGNVTTFALLDDLPYESLIYIRIIPYNNAGEAFNCSLFSFTTQPDFPTCAEILSPKNGEMNVSTMPKLSWQIDSLADGYLLFMGYNIGTYDIIDSVNIGFVNEYTIVNSLNFDSDIYFKVIPYNIRGWLDSCSTVQFHTEAPPAECTMLLSPSNGEIDIDYRNVILQWNESNNAEGYLIDVGVASAGNQILDNFDVGLATSYMFTFELPQNTGIYVKVKPYNSSGIIVDCDESYFITKGVIPGCTSLTLPLNGSVNVETDVEFNWTAAYFATGYNMKIGTFSGGEDLLPVVDIGNVLSYSLPFPLPNITKIFVSIIPYNNGGTSLNCFEESFTTKPLVPNCTSLIYPLDQSNSIPVEIEIIWNEVAFAEGYVVDLGTTEGGSELLDSFIILIDTSLVLSNPLPYNTKIFTTITPYNVSGLADSCLSFEFTTALQSNVKDNKLNEIQFFPNPTSGVVNIKSNHTIKSIKIYNELGQLIKKWNSENRLNIQSIPNGLYLIIIKFDNGRVATKKLLKI